MKAIEDPVQETYGVCYLARFTDEFEKLINKATETIEPYRNEETSCHTYYFKVKGEEVSSEFDCCDNKICVKNAKISIRDQYGKGTHIEECYSGNDGDYEAIELCPQCDKPLNEWLTWCDSELEHLEDCKPWNSEFIKSEGFLIHCILQSSPTMDCDISGYAKHQKGDILKEALNNREQFFQRIGNLAESIIECNL